MRVEPQISPLIGLVPSTLMNIYKYEKMIKLAYLIFIVIFTTPIFMCKFVYLAYCIYKCMWKCKYHSLNELVLSTLMTI